MSYVLGVAFMVASIALLHLVRWILSRLRHASPARQTLVAEVGAICFAALFAVGLIAMSQELATHLDPMHAAGLVLALVAAYLGSRRLGRHLERLEARHSAATAAVTTR